MTITLRRANVFSRDFGMIRALYNSAFPGNERAPLWLLTLRAAKKGVDFWSLHDKERDKFIGLLYIVSSGEVSYIFYLAIDEAERGKGYGSAVLGAVLRHYSDKRLFLSVERLDEPCDNYEQRVRRRSFYLKNGFEDKKRHIREGGMTFDMFGVGDPPTGNEYDKLIDEYFGFMRKFITMKLL